MPAIALATAEPPDDPDPSHVTLDLTTSTSCRVVQNVRIMGHDLAGYDIIWRHTDHP